MKYYHLLLPALFFGLLLSVRPVPCQGGWTALTSGTSYDLRAVYPLDYGNIFVTGDGARVLRSADSGATWIDISPAFSSVNLNDIVFFDTLNGLVAGDAGTIYQTSDGGTNWITISSGIADNIFSVSFSDSQGICGGASQSILYSDDAGQSWTVVQSGFFGGGFWGAYMLNPNLGYLMGENSIFQPMVGVTSDGGASWNFVPFYLNSNEGRGYDVIFTDIQRGYAACGVWDGRGAIARTTDGGYNWGSTFFSGPLYAVNFPISAASLVGYVAGEGGAILKTTDAGNSWQIQSSGTIQRIDDISFLDFDYGFAVGAAGTILKTETGGDPPVGIVNHDESLPERIELLGNYPNPFNPKTTISWYLTVHSPVNLTIYNAAGQKVTELVNEIQLPGKHKVEFQADNFSSGIYYYRLQAAEFVETRKMILVK